MKVTDATTGEVLNELKIANGNKLTINNSGGGGGNGETGRFTSSGNGGSGGNGGNGGSIILSGNSSSLNLVIENQGGSGRSRWSRQISLQLKRSHRQIRD